MGDGPAKLIKRVKQADQRHNKKPKQGSKQNVMVVRDVSCLRLCRTTNYSLTIVLL